MADESLDEVSTLDISKLKVPDLKKELKSRGLSTTGNKNELIERLQAAMKSSEGEGGTTDCIDDIEEDLLNDDDDDHIDERESLINDLDSALDDLPKAQKRKSEEKSEISSGPPKKVILKRNTSETLAAMAKASKPEEKPMESNSTEEKDGKTGSEEKKVIKLSELSVKERLEMRAKKFGVIEFSDDTKKVARAERFGVTGTNKTSNSGGIGKEADANIDVLKQRAARFGVSVSSVMSDLEKKEKMEKRKERFGAGTEVNGKTSTDVDAAKVARLERFKTTVK